eukprot:14392727-Alexandrium_andersonii.AAC.1
MPLRLRPGSSGWRRSSDSPPSRRWRRGPSRARRATRRSSARSPRGPRRRATPWHTSAHASRWRSRRLARAV